ncbi:MAG: DEAD/DEAH box helicase [Proteobacteria bacterium]|nr:DEAD/DEAH box helicase [Pseudomonadota bacterium]
MSHHHPRDIRKKVTKFLSGIGVPEQKEFKPDTFQMEAIESLVSGQDTLVVAPTGAGKTYIAVQAIKSFVQQKKRAVYTAPLKALSNSKFAEFKKLFEPEFSVGLLTGDRKIEGGADIVVATTEIYRNELYSYTETYSLVVLDEFHYLSDPQRGPVWEESIILSPKSSTILMLSASISNAQEISNWIETVRGTKVKIIKVEKRPVELRLGFIHPDIGVIPLSDEDGNVMQEVVDAYQRREPQNYQRRGGGGNNNSRRGRSGGGSGRRRR